MQPMISKEKLMASTLVAVEEISANEAVPFDVRLSGSLDALDKTLGFRRSALVYQFRGSAPVLVAHARDEGDETVFRNDMRNVNAILSSSGEKGVIRSALSMRSSIVLNDVTKDTRYVAADGYSFSEACMIETLCDQATLALNVEAATPGAFSAREMDFLASLADYFAMVLFQNAPGLFAPLGVRCERTILH